MLSTYDAVRALAFIVGIAALPLLLAPRLSVRLLQSYSAFTPALRIGGIVAAAVGALLLTAEPTDSALYNAFAGILGTVAVAKGVIALLWPAGYGRLVLAVSARPLTVLFVGLLAACFAFVVAVMLPINR